DVVIEHPNKRLKEQLALELPAVLAWMVRGYRDWHENGLAEPAPVLTATAAYRASSDALGRFLDESVIESQLAAVRARELFGVWSAWCHGNGEQPGSEVTFAEAMATRGFKKVKRSGVMHYL